LSAKLGGRSDGTATSFSSCDLGRSSVILDSVLNRHSPMATSTLHTWNAGFQPPPLSFHGGSHSFLECLSSHVQLVSNPPPGLLGSFCKSGQCFHNTSM
jgi:hypothetical protein